MEVTPRRFVSLLSSGLDSPIAVYLMMKQGYDAILLSYDVSNDPQSLFKKKINEICSHLQKKSSHSISSYIVDHQKTLQEFIEKGKRKLTCVLCKSYMLFSAYLLVQKTDASFIVNGDILGEQASQTLQNISVIQKQMSAIPVIRPLIGFEKKDVLSLSHQNGFYELSTLPDVPCSYNPMYPETHANPLEVQESIMKVNLEQLARSNLENAHIRYYG
jgi:thiamine biosynthesis protein ThiI